MLVNVRRNWNLVSREAKGTILGIAAASATLGITFSMAAVLHGLANRADAQVPPLASAAPAPLSAQVVRGRTLFTLECASCHGANAQGGFGPDLRRLEMPDAQVAATIQNGITPGMPAFGRQYGPADVQALTVYVRSLHH